MKETPAEFFIRVGEDLVGQGNVTPGARIGNLEQTAREDQQALIAVSEKVPYIAFQYDGGQISSSFGRFRETARAITYVVWDRKITDADKLEQLFVDMLLRDTGRPGETIAGRIISIGPSFSFIDSSTRRPGAWQLNGIQREVLIRS